MTKKSKTIVFFGNERIATGVTTSTPTLRSLLAHDYTIAAIVANYEKGTSRNTRKLEVQQFAEKHQIPLLLPNNVSDIRQELIDIGADAGVLVAYGKIITQEIIDLFPSGIINIHPSLLPKHRGSTPIESVLLNGETTTGVSLMKLVKAMDAGPVFGYTNIKLKGDETKQILADNLLESGASMLIELLPGILDGSIVAEPQNESQASYDQQIKKSDGIIDWHKPATQIEREIRAYAHWPKSTTVINGMPVIISDASVVSISGKPGEYEATKDSLRIYCGKDSLQINRIQPAGKKEMPIQAFLAGYKI